MNTCHRRPVYYYLDDPQIMDNAEDTIYPRPLYGTTKRIEMVELTSTEIRRSLDTSPGSKLHHKCNSLACYQPESNGLLHPPLVIG